MQLPDYFLRSPRHITFTIGNCISDQTNAIRSTVFRISNGDRGIRSRNSSLFKTIPVSRLYMWLQSKCQHESTVKQIKQINLGKIMHLKDILTEDPNFLSDPFK